MLAEQSVPPGLGPEPSAAQVAATWSAHMGCPGVQAWLLQLALPSSSRQNMPVAHMDDSVLPAPLASHFQIAPSLQNLVFGTHAVSVHTPSEQACEGKQVCAMVSLAPSAAQTLTFNPSQRRSPAPHDPPGGTELFPPTFSSGFVEFDFF